MERRVGSVVLCWNYADPSCIDNDKCPTPYDCHVEARVKDMTFKSKDDLSKEAMVLANQERLLRKETSACQLSNYKGEVGRKCGVLTGAWHPLIVYFLD